MGREKPMRMQPMMKNINEGKGIFAPLVVITRDIVGKKSFNQIRGKAISDLSIFGLRFMFDL
ncbi:hypothetical protein Lal_00034245 [Lupinus albus]|nr:hypothetical protein Lal_00034245 [Lupinus albus]